MITASAIKQDGVIYTGKRHHNCIRTICEARPDIDFVDGEQGFVDDQGNFLTREEGMKHAIACGQIEKGKWSDVTLYSEDLW